MSKSRTDQVWQQLRTVIDPELGINIVDLGLIYQVELLPVPESEQDKVRIVMTLTSPGCPLAGQFEQMVCGALQPLDWVADCQVELTFDPPWSMDKMSEAAKMELGFF